ncbi:uncharacterized protein [Argopecten irradians]|uniref:uncharacterized protein isoform X2 n=1 Tax=Argopecten irradians TaxID=31199 RepID=UPI003714C03F
MIASNELRFTATPLNAIVTFYATLFVCQTSLQLVHAASRQSETKTVHLDRPRHLHVQNFEWTSEHESNVKKNGYVNETFIKNRGSNIPKRKYVDKNTLSRTDGYDINHPKSFTIKAVVSKDNKNTADIWNGYCPTLTPWLIDSSKRSTSKSEGREGEIKVVLRKRKERTIGRQCRMNICCIFSNFASVEIFRAWFMEDHKSFSSNLFCCKISVLSFHEHMFKHDLDIHITDFDRLGSGMELGKVRINVYHDLDQTARTFNQSNDLHARDKRDAFIFNSSRNFNTSSFQQISIQNNIDASWGMVSIFIVMMFVILVGCCLKMFDMKQNNKVHFQYHDGIHLMFVNDLMRRKARLLPMFQSAWRQHDEEILFERRRKGEGRVPLVTVVEEEEGQHAENYNDDEH